MCKLLWLCFGISGVAALALEMLWMRSAGLVLGATAQTTATVLACYFAGLGLGAMAARHICQRPVRWYGWLEIGAGVGAVWSLLAFHLLSNETMQGWLVSAGTIGRIAAIATAVLPPTLCLGATLPALGQALTSAETVGHRGGLLYALNTLGAVLGAAAAGFGLPALIGVRGSYGVVACASLLAGVLALTIGDSERKVFSTSTRISLPTTGLGHLRFIAAATGALGIGLEVLWIRLFTQVLHNSIYSFTAIVLVFLLSIATGAVLAALLLRRTTPTALASGALVVAAGTTLSGLWLFVYWTDGLAYFGMRSGLVEYLFRVVILAAVVVGPGAVASGVVLPALWAAWGTRANAAHPLRDLSAANTLGGVVGAIAIGFLMIPTLGSRGTLLAVATAYLVLADVLAPSQS